MLKAVCQSKVQPIGYSLNEPQQQSVAVRLTGGSGVDTTAYCAQFGGTVVKDAGTGYPGNGKFIATDAASTGACAVPPSACP
jgi:hypothetical protein